MTGVLVAIIVVLVIGLGICIFALVNLLRKYEDAEDKFNSSESEREKYELYINSLIEKLKEIDTKVHELDKRGSFEADDEVGFFFKGVKQLNEELRIFTESGE